MVIYLLYAGWQQRMHLGFGSHVGLPKTIRSRFCSSQDPRRVPHLSHQTKSDSEDLYIKATINQFILVARNYPVAIVSMICLCRSVVNLSNGVANCIDAWLGCLFICKYSSVAATGVWLVVSGPKQRTID